MQWQPFSSVKLSAPQLKVIGLIAIFAGVLDATIGFFLQQNAGGMDASLGAKICAGVFFVLLGIAGVAFTTIDFKRGRIVENDVEIDRATRPKRFWLAVSWGYAWWVVMALAGVWFIIRSCLK